MPSALLGMPLLSTESRSWSNPLSMLSSSGPRDRICSILTILISRGHGQNTHHEHLIAKQPKKNSEDLALTTRVVSPVIPTAALRGTA